MKSNECQTPGTSKNPGQHPVCPLVGCVCTCHERLNRHAVANGVYTVGTGDLRRTIRVSDADWARERGIYGVGPSTQGVSLLSGPNNEADYTFIGWLNGSVFSASKKHAGNELFPRLLLALVADPTAAGMEYARESQNCYICNRLLTTPESIAAGIGPVCAEKVGAAA